MLSKRFGIQSIAVVVALGLVALSLSMSAFASQGREVQTVRLNISPLNAPADPGPTTLIGAGTGLGSQPGGVKFVWVDLMVDGPGDCRVYFDFKDNDHFHFLDRKGAEVTLGLRESGVEQIFATGTLNGDGGMRLARHGCKMGVFQNGALAAYAFDDRILEGAAGIRTLSAGPAVKLRAEPREDIHYAEDFMIEKGMPAGWTGNGDGKHGYFEVKSLRHPLLSANAFSAFGVGENINCVTGQTWWDNYTYELSIRGPAVGKIGLVFAYQDPLNYGLFRWGSRGKDGGMPAKRELVRVREGKEEVIAQAPGGYAPDQWYKATLNVSYSRVSVAIDKHVLLEVTDPYLAAGAAGLWCDVPFPDKLAKDPKELEFTLNSLEGLMRQHAVFDDVRIRSQEDFEERFASSGTLKSGWLVGEGDWTVSENAVAANKNGAPGNSNLKSGKLSVRCAQESKALIGDRRWSQYQISADVLPVNKGVVGIVLMHRDESNYYIVKIENGMLKLVRVAGGVEQVEDNAPITVGNDPIRIQAVVKKGHLRATTDDGASVEAFDGATRLRGRAGLYAKSSGGDAAPCGEFASFHIEFLPEPEPLVTSNAIFEEEASMNDWSNNSTEWIPPADGNVDVQDGKVVTLLWHRSQFPGDLELMAEPREITEPSYSIALSCSKDGLTKNNGYVYSYKVTDDKNGKPDILVQILRQGALVAEKHIGDDVRQLSTLAIRRCGKYIVGLVNGKTVLYFRDEEPLKGSKVAFKTQGILIKTEAMRITSDHFRNDTFSGAAVNWRTAGYAIAEVTNRWQCDPRWTFFSLQNDLRSGGKPAVLWSKQLYPGDVTVEFYFGNKMDHMRGNPYVYARDINVSIGSDGSDLTKGYTFSFGGNNNTTSYIMRDGVIVKQFPARIPTDMNWHRHWFAFKAERQGNLLKFRVDHFFQSEKRTPDGKMPAPELVFEDTVPLTGDRVAIWTYDHGMMISKVRISGDNGEDTESPDFLPAPVKTVYDDQQPKGR